MSFLNVDGATVEEVLPVASRTLSTDGDGVDVLAYNATAKIVLMSSAGGGASPTLNVKIQDSADDVTYADVSGAVFAEVTGTASTQAINLRLGEVRQYIRAVATIGGTTPSFDCGVAVVGRKESTS